MTQKFKSSKSIKELLERLRLARTKPPSSLSSPALWRESLDAMNDDDLHKAADYLRAERLEITKKLIEQGVLSPDAKNNTSSNEQ